MRPGKRRQRAFQFEVLEERLNLSSVSWGLPQIAAERSAPRRHQKITASFRASGQVTPSHIIDNPDGSFTVTASISGTGSAQGKKKTTLSKAFGPFTGTITGTTGTGSTTTTIQFRKGSLSVSLMASGSITQGSDTGTFTITGGSGAFARAMGGGTFTASVSGAGSSNPTLSFQFSGKVTIVK